MSLTAALDVQTYQEFLSKCGKDEDLLNRFLARPSEVLAEFGINVDRNVAAEEIAVSACNLINEEYCASIMQLRDDELDAPFAASCDTKTGTSRSGPVTNATNCARTCGLC